ncbi:hypothetical protein I4U23_020192 [Adineta vaga]|nr:hypothetical protein I4U23_020192 [Adineta vaga]
MSQEKERKSSSRYDLTKVYKFNKAIKESRVNMLIMSYNELERGATVDKERSIRIENLRIRINKLTLMRHDELMRIYSHVKTSRIILTPPSTPVSSERPLSLVIVTQPVSSHFSFKIENIVSEPDCILIDMVPTSCDTHVDSDQIDDDSIIYPEGVTDLHPYQIVAHYRKVAGKSTNFREYPLIAAEDSNETLILGLDNFARQHDCTLIFSDQDQQFDQSIYRAACGIADLGSIHLLANDSLLTANFQFELDLDYNQDIAKSADSIQQFVIDFCNAIAQVLSCDNDIVRIFSIKKIADQPGKSDVNFGLTTPELKRTEQLAHDLQIHGRSGFSNETILQHVKARDYECIWKSAISYLQIRPDDLDPRYNFDYRQPGVPNEDLRGGYPYYLPLGWYRHALNVSTKYENDQIWLGRSNADGEWPVAFHGTSKDAVTGIVAKGFLINAVKTDVKRQEAIDLIGEEADRPGLYVATHCNGGSDIYTTPFTVTTFPDKSEQFRIVFQCRVQPKKFTCHTSPVNVGEAWRIVDPNAIRPYGILLKKEGSSHEQNKD